MLSPKVWIVNGLRTLAGERDVVEGTVAPDQLDLKNHVTERSGDVVEG